jgi:ubiquinone/menaquinone biosynthesis C-methylase UbiE
MENPQDSVKRMYENRSELEWQRLEMHRTEFAVTLRALEEYLPPGAASILDCGGGPGRYAIELARRGHRVTLFDLSASNLATARDKAAQAGVYLFDCQQGTATDLSRFPDQSFDTVLLMGPLYHLLEENERRAALVEAYRVLKPGGRLFAAFLSRYAAHRDMAAKNPLEPVTDRAICEEILRTGRLLPRHPGELEFVAYFTRPGDAGPFVWSCGFEVLNVLGMEGLVSQNESGVNALKGAAWQLWVDLNYRVASDPSLHGGCEHLLVVATRPAWKAVMARLAARLDLAGVAYRVVGGASPAIHEMPLPVKDIDIETDTASAALFAELFPENLVERPVLRESDTYRSVFGRFNFDGVTLEVMGGLQRRDGDTWLPSQAETEDILAVEGTPVRVSWLEEETLAYMRRGKLERASLCLNYCEPERLKRLLTRQQPTNVI